MLSSWSICIGEVVGSSSKEEEMIGTDYVLHVVMNMISTRTHDHDLDDPRSLRGPPPRPNTKLFIIPVARSLFDCSKN